MNRLSNILEGRKTYASIILLFALGGAKSVGWIDENTYQSLLTMCMGLLGFGLYSKMKRM